MYFQQYYLSCLAHASYLIGDGGLGIVVDPRRDVDIYLEDAEKEGLRIAYVVETHLHADFVSGHRELAERTGAQVVVSHRARAGFPHLGVKDGDEISVGKTRLRVLETPGHTPESICLLVFDPERPEVPSAVLTGDTLFIGDVGRPDLSAEYGPRELAGMLHDSLHGKLMPLPDSVRVYPAHGAGSLCGRAISSDRSSTLGRERETNAALRPMSREAFIDYMTADLPERPGYFASDAEINRVGPSLLPDLPPLVALDPEALLERQRKGAVVLDTRPSEAFAAAHVPGSVQIGLGGQFASWAGTVLGVAAEVVVVSSSPEKAAEARTRLARVGIDGVSGFLGGGLAAWREAALPVSSLPLVSPREVSERGACAILDVRRPPEWERGRLASARLVPLAELPRRLPALLAELPGGVHLVVHCQGGYRSTIAASLLLRAGRADVWDLAGGFDAWKGAGLPVDGGAKAAACGTG